MGTAGCKLDLWLMVCKDDKIGDYEAIVGSCPAQTRREPCDSLMAGAAPKFYGHNSVNSSFRKTKDLHIASII